MLKLEWLEAFAAFAEHQNFTRAAAALHLSQPALHVQIQKLGEALGVPLYRRKGRQLMLTAEGRRAAEFGRDLGERTRELVDELRNGGERRPVVLCAGEGAYLYLLGEGIRRFVGRGGAGLKLLTRDREGTLEAVRAGDAQVGVAALDEIPADLETEPLTEVGQELAMPRAHPLAKKRKIQLRDLAGARLVVPARDRPHRVLLAGALSEAGVPWEIAVEANGWELMLRFVQLGIGLAVVNSCCAAPKGVVKRPLPELPSLRYHVIRRRGAAAGLASDRLVEALLKAGSAWDRAGG